MIKRNAGIAVVLAVALTAAVRLPLAHSPTSLTQVEAAKSAVKRDRPHKPAASVGYVGGCTAYDPTDDQAAPDENRGSAKSLLDHFFDSDPAQETAHSLNNQPGVRYAIAIVADPRHTNLSLVFDRQMSTMQQAAQDELYTYDSSWLPWQVEDKTYQLLADQQTQDDLSSHREACPGIVLFRRSTSLRAPSAVAPFEQALVVLVVGEQPTGGLNQDQWTNAIRWLGRNASQEEVAYSGQHLSRILRVLGPSFSGTLVSLGRELSQLYPAQSDTPAREPAFSSKFPQASVLSGSVTDCASVRWFQQLSWAALPNRQNHPSVVFGTFEENDERQIWTLLNYLKAQGTDPNDTAILSEDETAYSGTEQAATEELPDKVKQPCTFHYASDHRPVRLFFPRDISALRNAYEKESIFTSSSSGIGEHSVHTILQENGGQAGEEGNPSDTIPAYSGHLTPVSQEAMLYGIVSYMRAHHTRYVLLRCSNPLDFLFLTRFFHRAYPEGRIVTVGSDLLFRREIDTTEFRGVLSLSNYPLLPRNQHWSMLSEKASPMPGHAHRAFETATVEGTYLAARYLFSSGDQLARPLIASTYLSLPLMELLPEYADPFWLHTPTEPIHESRAPIWLVVVGRDGYWPVAVLNDASTPQSNLDKNRSSDPARPAPPSTMVRLRSIAAHYDLDRDGQHFHHTLRSRLPLPWTITAVLAFSLLLYQACGIFLGDENSAQGLFAAFRRVSAPSQDVLLGINSAFAAILLVAPLSIGLTIPHASLFSASDWEYLSFLVLGLAEILTVAISLGRNRSRLAVLCFLCVFLALSAISLGTLEAALIPGHANRLPLFYRMGHLTAGIAPLLPVLCLFSGFYCWTWHAMAGNVLLCNGRPILPKLERIKAKQGFARWYWILLGNPVDATGQGFNRLKASQIRISQELGKRLVEMASPLSAPLPVVALPFCLLIGAWVCFHADLPLLSMEGRAYALWLNVSLLLAFLLVAAEASRLFWTWMQLRRMLAKLNRLRLRRTFARLRVIEAKSLWSVSGGVQRVQYAFFAQQLEAAGRLRKLVPAAWPALDDAIECGHKFDRLSARRLSRGPRWDEALLRPRDLAPVAIRDVFADAVAEVLNRILYPWWSNESTSLALSTSAASIEDENRTVLELPLSDEPAIRTAEEFVCFHYIAFIQNILARMRTMTLSMILLFLAVSFAISFYPFVPRTQISMWMIVNLALIGSAVLYVYAGMDRDEIISYITNTRPGRLSGEFWLKSAAFLAGPLIGIITTQFPAVADSVLGWVQPGLDAIGK